jgi:deoxyribodipyrimidine photo-lyase
MKKALLWFKNDLRLTDNESLVKAVENQFEILCLYCIDPRLFQFTEYNFRKMGANRYTFLQQCLEDLSNSLKKHGGDLLVVVGEPEVEIPKIVAQYGIEAIYAEQEYATEEKNMIKELTKNLPENFNFQWSWGKTLYHLDDISFSIEEIPMTSKAFRIPTSKNTEVRPTFAIPEKISFVNFAQNNSLPSLQDLGFSDEEIMNQKPFVIGGETKALERLNYYFYETQLLTNYKWTRNKSLGMDFSSKFSAYMALGCLSPRTIYEQVKHYEQTIKRNISTWWLVFEVVWRDFFTFKLMRFQNKVYQTEGIKGKPTNFENNEELFQKWCTGTTGIPFVDANMRQLNQTGFMSNRGRVNCSSFLIHDYKIDWTWGAAYFESKLIDYDVASNWLNWHTQAFEIWYTNPVNQPLKYKEQAFIREWIPELRDLNDQEVLIPWESLEIIDYPKPVEIFSKWNRAISAIKKSNL